VSVVEFRKVTYNASGKIILDNISFSVSEGNFVGIVGQNGSGKTTLVRTMLGLLKQAEGEVKLFGEIPEQFRDWRKVGYIPQKVFAGDSKFPLTAFEAVSLGLLSGKKNPKTILAVDRDKVRATLHALDITSIGDKLVGNLSGGQQQRVMLARALVNDPELLVLDEPTAALDVAAGEAFMKLIRDLNEIRKVTVILVTHDIANIGKYADKMLYIDKKMVFYGTFGDFCISPDAALYFGKYAQHIICHRHDHERAAGEGHNA